MVYNVIASDIDNRIYFRGLSKCYSAFGLRVAANRVCVSHIPLCVTVFTKALEH